jgi:predicted phosphodiesterase
MAAPSIALRFRDTTPGIDTIEEHRKLIDRFHQVGWGWWKKTFEDVDQQAIASTIAKAGGAEILLIDTSTQRAFACRCSGLLPSNKADPKLVPEYYREHLAEIAGVFILQSIVNAEFDAALAARVGEQTFLRIGEAADPAFAHVAAVAMAVGRTCILHLSDLHFGIDYGFRRQDEDVNLGDPRKTLTDCIVADLNRLGLADKIAAVIVTGDFMTQGKWDNDARQNALEEFGALRDRLSLEQEQVIALAGNHDVVRYPEQAAINVKENAVERQANYQHEVMFRFFVNELIGRDVKASLNYMRRLQLGPVDLDVCVLNSCTIAATEWTEYGYVGKNGLDAISKMSSQTVERPTFRFLALHHHLLPVANVEALNSKGVTLTLDASQILEAAQLAGVNVVLHGHQHKPKVATYQNLQMNGEPLKSLLHVVANGSTGARNSRLPPGERNTYCLFRLAADGLELWIRELRLDGVLGAELFRGKLATNPTLP